MLSEFTQRKMTLIFYLLDRDKNNYIEKEDFDQIFDKMTSLLGISDEDNRYLTMKSIFEERWDLLIGDSDADMDSKVSLDEWMSYCESVLASNEEYNQHIKALSSLIFESVQDNGKITKEGLRIFYEAYGMDPEIAEFVFPNFDLDMSGAIEIDEMRFLFDQFHRSEDPQDPGNLFFGELRSA